MTGMDHKECAPYISMEEVPNSAGSLSVYDTEMRLREIEQKIDHLDAKLSAVLASVNEIVSQARPALEQVMNSPILAMLTGSGGKKR